MISRANPVSKSHILLMLCESQLFGFCYGRKLVAISFVQVGQLIVLYMKQISLKLFSTIPYIEVKCSKLRFERLNIESTVSTPIPMVKSRNFFVYYRSRVYSIKSNINLIVTATRNRYLKQKTKLVLDDYVLYECTLYNFTKLQENFHFEISKYLRR